MGTYDATAEGATLLDVEDIKTAFRELNDRAKLKALDDDEQQQWSQLKKALIAVLAQGEH